MAVATAEGPGMCPLHACLCSKLMPVDPTESWDEDFEFNNRPSNSDSLPGATEAATPLSKDRKNTLRRWTEPGPSTPSKRAVERPENWDDDFRDSTNSPARRRSHQQHIDEDSDNWDDDFEDGTQRRSPRRKTPRKKPSWGSSDEDDEFGFADKEEDRTVTSRSRGMPITIPRDMPPPVPPLPSPFPRSPTASVFSMPVSSNGRDSVAAHSFSSTGHLALGPMMSAGSSALALLPPSPPIHRERRRLRKKSRPPAMIPDMYEMDEQEPPPPSTPERKTSALPDELPDPEPSTSAAAAGTSSGKTPLLSRIGSVGKKWGASRKKRASTGPSEVILHESQRERGQEERMSRPQSVVGSPPAQKGGWFFRGGGGGGPGPPPANEGALRHETSVDRLLALAGIERGLDSPSRKGSARPRMSGDGDGSVDRHPVAGPAQAFPSTPKRPTSMQIQQSLSTSSSGSSLASRRAPMPRHASYGHDLVRRPGTAGSRSSSKPRSASASTDDVVRTSRSATVREGCYPQHQPDPTMMSGKGKDKDKDKEGSRSFMGGMRRISLGGSAKHKRMKSSAPPEEDMLPAPAAADLEALQDQTTPRPPSRIVRSSQDGLLPPIELEPPSPPRRAGGDRHRVSAGGELRSLFRLHPMLESSRSHPALSSSRSPTPIVVRKTPSPSGSPPASPLPSPTVPRQSTSPQQAASLGRATQPPKERDVAGSGLVPRRNSLGDLKIPARISQAQVGLRRDLGMVREFAMSVERESEF